MNCTVVGRRLRAFLRSRRAYAVLGPKGGDWSGGGCWLLAAALARVLRGGAGVRGVWGYRDGFHGQQHAVVQVGSCYLDGDGGQTAEQLLRKMRTLERIKAPYLGRWQPARARRDGIPCPLGKQRELVKLLKEHV